MPSKTNAARRLEPERAAHFHMSTCRIPSAAAASDALSEITRLFQAWLFMPETGALEAALSAYAANMMPGDPVWLMLVGPPSSGKTELLNTFAPLPSVYTCTTLTESALLSGTAKDSRSHDSTGGLLREVGEEPGLLLFKDFTAVLSMKHETRTALLAALREIYDGHWVRNLGVDGGRSLRWDGKLGMLSGVTEAIDSYHGVMSMMGPRFLLFRMPRMNAKEQARRALTYHGEEESMRDQLRTSVIDFFGKLELVDNPTRHALADTDGEWLITLTELVSLCRSHVQRDSRDRHIEHVPDPELPGRMTRALAQLWCGVKVIGVAQCRQRALIRKVAFDSIPPARRRVVDFLTQERLRKKTAEIAAATALPLQTCRLALEDLHAHGILEHGKEGWIIDGRWKQSLKVTGAKS